jgi:diguanylate cyclase (GGDEF)-like protein
MRKVTAHWRAVCVSIPLLVCALLAYTYRIPLIFGLSIGLQSIFLLLGLRLFGPTQGILIASLAGVSGYAITGEAGAAFLAVLEIAVVGGCLLLRNRSLLPYDAVYWVTIGSAVTLWHYYGTYHTIDTELFLLLFTGFVNGIANALLAEMVFLYSPLKRFVQLGKEQAVSFSQVLYHVSISALILPFLLFIAAVGYFQYKDMTNHASRLALNISSSLQNELSFWSRKDLGLLQLNALIQVSRLDEVVQRFGRGSGVEIMLMDREGYVIAASVRGMQNERWNWKSGGEVRQAPNGLSLWLPKQDTPYELKQWSRGYFVHVSKVPNFPIHVVVRVPVAYYLKVLVQVYAVNFGTLLFFILAAVAAGSVISRWISDNFFRLARMTSGLHKQIIKSEEIEWPSSEIKELRALIANFQSLWARLVAIFNELKQANESLEEQTQKLIRSEEDLHRQVYYDSLTGLRNRRYYSKYVSEQIAGQYGSKQSIAVLFMDLDRFKHINDSLGHVAGDELLQRVAERIGRWAAKGAVFRMGGDEFVVVIPQTNRTEIERLTEGLYAAISDPIRLRDHEFYVKCSIGISMYPEDAQDAETLTKYADMAMYQAKAAGGNRYAFFTTSMAAKMEEKLMLENQLDKALELRQFELVYQPAVSLITGEIIGAEVRIRWNHPEWGQLLQDRFLQAAEDTGSVIDIGSWAIVEACAQLSEWRHAGFPLTIAIPISGKQLYDKQLELTLKEAIAAYGLKPGSVELGIKENALGEERDAAVPLLQELQGLGVRLALDDFGSSNSSLMQIALLPIDALKIDMARMNRNSGHGKNNVILKTIIELAQGLDLEVAAKGVETEQDLAEVQNHKVHYVQGDRFGKAVPGSEFERLLLHYRNRSLLQEQGFACRGGVG